MKKIVTSESVFRGHPDKICDQISDAILDECLRWDPASRVGVECAIKDNALWIFGEITTSADVNCAYIARKALMRMGYCYNYRGIRCHITSQSKDIAHGVDRQEQGAGDQGMVFGYACREAPNLMPWPIYLAHKIAKAVEIERLRGALGGVLLPDGKCQVSCRYVDGGFVGVDTIVISTQTTENTSITLLHEHLTVMLRGVLGHLYSEDIKLLVNPAGDFNIGGPEADAGLTGRKIIVDTYGGCAHHGGGAFSGKDPSKVDRSGAYYARYVAKAIVAANLADKCEICVSYAIGLAEPISISVDTFNTANFGLDDDKILELIKEHFDFRPASMEGELLLRKIRYEPYACYGHMGREDLHSPWENVGNKVYRLWGAVKCKS